MKEPTTSEPVAQLIADLRLIADWHKPVGRIPKWRCPDEHAVCLRAADLIESRTTPQEHPAVRQTCDDCKGSGRMGEYHYQGEFQPPEQERCSTCDGSGSVSVTIDELQRVAYAEGRRDEAEERQEHPALRALREAAAKALKAMCRVSAPDSAFTDTVDELDAALAAARAALPKGDAR